MVCQRRFLEKLVCVAILAAMLAVALSQAQVTFSRDWNAGKRSLAEAGQPMGECAAIRRSVANLCTAITRNIQHLTLCESRHLMKNMQADDSSIENSSGNNMPLFGNNQL
ncbi:adipokinetic hormone/corazonin-related peptide-like [Uranotaenia lowii]|uniref:adipokinetic hormone/corazonin-related peptide-like n=1 Tax=Uranotaenia lowii TaxID=190385 RepID=UPI002479030D|nr:adipokinetic hormone/corazonin-related peptide-like [Uranotaenia lowii]